MINKERKVLSAVLVVAAFYVFVTALIMFNVEPQINPVTGSPTFKSFFDALYWATVTLTTVGYGDVCPVTSTGRFVSMLSSIFGVAIIALPSGILTASYLDELRSNRVGRQSGDTPVQEVKEVEESSNNKKRFVSLETGNKSLRNMKDHLIVTISRELGSGGRTVGRKLAEQLGVRYSDKDLVNALRKKFNLTTSHIEELKGEKKNWLSDLIKWVAPMPKEKQLVDVDSKFIQEFRSEVTTDDVFKAETEILKGIADEGSCVIAGRSGFFVLKDYPDKVDIFITAPRKNRIARVMRKQNLTEDQAAAVIDSVDASRENYIKRYTGTSRYDARNYDLVINMDGLTEDEAVALILAYIKDENTGA